MKPDETPEEAGPVRARWTAGPADGTAEGRAGALLRQATVEQPLSDARLAAVRARLGERKRGRSRPFVLQVAFALAVVFGLSTLVVAATQVKRWIELRAQRAAAPAPAPVVEKRKRGHRKAQPGVPGAPEDVADEETPIDEAAPAPEAAPAVALPPPTYGPETALAAPAPAPAPTRERQAGASRPQVSRSATRHAEPAAAEPVSAAPPPPSAASPSATPAPAPPSAAAPPTTTPPRGQTFEPPPAAAPPLPTAPPPPRAATPPPPAAPPRTLALNDPSPKGRAAAPPPPASPLAEESALLTRALRILRQKDDPRGALALFDDHARRFPNGPLAVEARVGRIEALLQLGRRTEALALLDPMTLPSTGRRRDMLVTRGELRAGADRCAEALIDFGLALTAESRDDAAAERALYGRASCRARLGDADGARADLQSYLARFPTGRFAADARATLR